MKTTNKLIEEAQTQLARTKSNLQGICKALNPYVEDELAARLKTTSKIIEGSH